jgi:NAD(P)H-flavin reductase
MSDTKYLFRRNGIWWAKVAVPRSLRAELGYDLRRSLGTRDLDVARAARDPVVAELRRTITEAVDRQRSCQATIENVGGFTITAREDFSPVTFLLEIAHPQLARAAKPGQFVLVLAHEHGERIPLTIADFDRDAGTFTMVIQAVGKTTREMQQRCQVGTKLHAVVGPMGCPGKIGDATKVVCVGGGLGIASIFTQLRAFRQHGAHVIGIVGFRTKELIFWEEKFRQYCDELIICTDDGSVGIHGLVTEGIELAIEQHPDIDALVAIGPPVMMRACVETTRPHGIRTTVSLNPIMVDGTGMCGGCRVTVGGEMKFTCVDGPEFDGHEVDFGHLMGRQRRFRQQEQLAIETWMREQEETPAPA